MATKNKTQALLFLALALAALFLLAAGLSSVSFRPGAVFSLRNELNRLLGGAYGRIWVVPILILGLLLLLGLQRRQPDKRARGITRSDIILRFVLMLAMLLWLYAFSQIPGIRDPGGKSPPQELPAENPASVQEQVSNPENRQEVVEPFNPQPPSWAPLLTGLALAGLATGLAAAALLYIRSRETAGLSALDRLADEAESAVDALSAGQDVRDVVIRSYIQMVRILEEERGIQRKISATPGEFETGLICLGFPKEPVHTLTWLFEQVRYGSAHPGESEQQQAIASLNAISAYCRNGGRSV